MVTARETMDTTNNHNEEFKQRREVQLWLPNKSKPRRACWLEQKGFEAQPTISHHGWGAWIWRGEWGRDLSPRSQTVGWAEEGAPQVSKSFAPKETVVLGIGLLAPSSWAISLLCRWRVFWILKKATELAFLKLWVRHKRQGVWRVGALTCRWCHIISWYALQMPFLWVKDLITPEIIHEGFLKVCDPFNLLRYNVVGNLLWQYACTTYNQGRPQRNLEIFWPNFMRLQMRTSCPRSHGELLLHKLIDLLPGECIWFWFWLALFSNYGER